MRNATAMGLVTAAALVLGGCVRLEGLMGVGQGARRLMVIPPDLAYPDGSGEIQPGETLVFVVDVLTVTGP